MRGSSGSSQVEAGKSSRRKHLEDHMHRFPKALAALGIGMLTALFGDAPRSRADEPNPVTAIDILLEPDATMIRHAVDANERLLKEFPKGFALGKTHQPHISCLQRYA